MNQFMLPVSQITPARLPVKFQKQPVVYRV